ncbi:MAG TPA: hypothetical protein VMV86_01095 [Methanosarcinales archaeon]|nr:hypothetical protein [Methanosarcinales archaeon]
MRSRRDISNRMVLEALELTGGNVNAARRELNCSYRLVWNAKHGIRKDPLLGTKLDKPVIIDNPCTCCGIRNKAPGNRFLCNICFRIGEEVY